ncbi:hypothetical protein PtrSN002B_009867 [Pyrenophora tritici-repentis]|uniref:Uncharacterized protein n=2 Tax=Pyrenophora tritici-repentis TaxID=45151 RepID=A0A2W1DLE4_9PLEO|nr:phosphotransferase enzyme family protein [Pyrenophora tritici-repentis Pt-1C-BFP]KAG9388194.1 hypothetical protein A1F94_001086 [Pyrenophora tritici-repentis]EDU40821.1 phosphotransferase enzyme family protein [Pyrenophora tritici-repentis Pt-1C-BFP]KAI0587052.1 hypothetical protein Alg215_01627 [Pyrenophora tritici-repentis]KAI1513504.1 hypothetical protein Ptr86124_007406 [Pyrenophora tritici-repentis]KAI1535554.1 hypothetical protein PtrSN002B_009867 [Pyrenophora tritici-repentis]
MAPESSPEFLPNQNARLPSRTTASEFTAIFQARNAVEIPVPEVLTWGSRADENPVAAELEEVPGIELERPWPSMNIQE